MFWCERKNNELPWHWPNNINLRHRWATLRQVSVWRIVDVSRMRRPDMWRQKRTSYLKHGLFIACKRWRCLPYALVLILISYVEGGICNTAFVYTSKKKFCFFRWQEMSGHLPYHAHMDVAFLRCRLRFHVQVQVISAEFTISLCQICIPVLTGQVAPLLAALMIPGTVNLCLEPWVLELTFQNFRGWSGFKMQPMTKCQYQKHRK